MNTQIENIITNTMNTVALTDAQKLSVLKDLGEAITIDKINNNGFISEQMRSFISGALYVVDECNESWCDHCEVRKALNCLCCDI